LSETLEVNALEDGNIQDYIFIIAGSGHGEHPRTMGDVEPLNTHALALATRTIKDLGNPPSWPSLIFYTSCVLVYQSVKQLNHEILHRLRQDGRHRL
jgi:hypothetical protein